MSSPQDQMDRYLDQVHQKNISKTEIPDDDAHFLEELVAIYQPVTLPSHKKQKLLENAQVMSTKQKRTIKPINWLTQVATLLIAAGIGALVIGLGAAQLPSMNANDMLQTQEILIADEQAIFDGMPQTSSAFQFEFGAHTDFDENFTHAKAMQNAGMTWIAQEIRYDPSSEQELLSQATEMIQQAHDQDFKIMFRLQGIASLLDPQYIKQYAFFASDLAHAGADAIEIWSEANLDREFPTEFLDTHEEYATLLRETAREASVANPDILIIAGAPAPTGAEQAFPGQVVNDDIYIERMVALNAYEHVDCIGIHYLEGIVPPLDTRGDLRDNYYTRYLPTMLQRYRQLVGAEIPFCFTEFGYLAGEDLAGLPPFFEWASETSREEQQHWTGEALEWLSLQADVRLVILWHVGVPTDNIAEEGFDLIFQ